MYALQKYDLSKKKQLFCFFFLLLFGSIEKSRTFALANNPKRGVA
jgi:hypothetical protein